MPASDWLPPEVVECLEGKAPSLADAVLVALNSLEVGRELEARGVTEMSGFTSSGSGEVLMPPGQERFVWPIIAAFHGCEAQDNADESAEDVKPKRGKWEKELSESETNKAAEIHLKNGKLTPWEVYVLYKRIEDRDEPGWLSRRMVARLIDDLEGEEPLLTWDAAAERDDGTLGRLRRPSGELWANFGRGVLPRREPSP